MPTRDSILLCQKDEKISWKEKIGWKACSGENAFLISKALRKLIAKGRVL
jgi:hypothetical protein